MTAISAAGLIIAGCAQTADTSATGSASVEQVAKQAKIDVVEEGASATELQTRTPSKVNRCETGTTNANVWGYFIEEEEAGGYDEYCFNFHPDGTLTYSDSGDTAKGAWSRSAGASTIEWRINSGYTWDGVPLPLKGTVEGVVWEGSGNISSHDRLTWTFTNRYGRSNIIKTYVGLPADRWAPKEES